MLGHPHRHRRQVEHLPPLDTHLGRGRQISTASGALAGLMPQPLVRIGHQRQCRPRMPRLPPGLRPLLRRNDFGAGLVNGESVDGGFDEFCEFCPSCRLNSAISASSSAIRLA